jgi:hypothetical protein
MRPPTKQSGLKQAFLKTTQHQKLGAAFKHLQNGDAIYPPADFGPVFG